MAKKKPKIGSFIPQTRNKTPWSIMIGRAVGVTHADQIGRKLRKHLKEAGEIESGYDQANPRNIAALIYVLFATDSIRHFDSAIDKFSSVYSAHSKWAEKYNNEGKIWPAITFLTILFSNKDLLDEVEKIEFSTRNGDFKVYYQDDKNPEWFNQDNSGQILDHEGKEFEPEESDRVNIVRYKFLERIYRALNNDWPPGIK